MGSEPAVLSITYLTTFRVFTTALHAFWAWLAAALIRFRHLNSSPAPPHHRTPLPSPPQQQPPQLPSSPKRKTNATSEEGVGTTSGNKFTVYYCQYDDEDIGGGGVIGEEDVRRTAREEGWEAVLLKMKTGEMGWYRYQDLTRLQGDVVRLWDGDELGATSKVN